MWIVVVVNYDYPSILHFDDEVKAKEAYEKYKEEGSVVHIAEVKDTTFNEEIAEDYHVYKNNIETWDVKWYI